MVTEQGPGPSVKASLEDNLTLICGAGLAELSLLFPPELSSVGFKAQSRPQKTLDSAFVGAGGSIYLEEALFLMFVGMDPCKTEFWDSPLPQYPRLQNPCPE